MNMNLSMKTHGTALAAALLGCMAASTAVAQQQPLDTQDLGPTSVGEAACAEVDWNREMLAQYPRLAEGCQEVVMSDGERWARFEADLVRASRNGSVTLDFKDRQGQSIDELTLRTAPLEPVRIDGREYRFSDLNAGQELSLYVPEGLFAVAVEPGVPAEELAEVVSPGTRLAQADEPAPRAAQADEPAPRAAPVERQLPSTAGPLPFVLLAGLISLVGGLGLTITRRFGAKKETS